MLNNKSIAVPLNNDAIAVIRDQIGNHETSVFTYRGNPVGLANTKAFRAALKRADIDDFCWHDLRHTWAELARSKRNTVTRFERIRRLGGFENGFTLRAFVAVTFIDLCK